MSIGWVMGNDSFFAVCCCSEGSVATGRLLGECPCRAPSRPPTSLAACSLPPALRAVEPPRPSYRHLANEIALIYGRFIVYDKPHQSSTPSLYMQFHTQVSASAKPAGARNSIPPRAMRGYSCVVIQPCATE